MNWAEERAKPITRPLKAVLTPQQYEATVDAIAAALQRVADQCAEVVDQAPCYRALPSGGRESTRRSSSLDYANDIRARFPNEER